LIVTSAADALPPLTAIGYKLTSGRKIPKIPESDTVFLWNSFLRNGTADTFDVCGKSADPAVILYSGGTTGVAKGIVLSNGNFNALAHQVIATNPMFRPGDRMLALMPVFHGFGLGVSIHSMLFHGGRCLLVPRFTVKTLTKLLKKEKCNFIAGVPSLYEALLREPSAQSLDLSSLKGVYSGGDSLSVGLKKRLDAFLKEHGSPVSVREGYGTTECVTASCLTPCHTFREGSIGVPFPDMYYKIVSVGTEDEVP
ncbi:MAG: AMP-binding protein, partial [Clostridia bacterium]|nr:AMP-binding protein [Clostridia bacterium]